MFIETKDVKSRVFYQYKILVSLSQQISFESYTYANLTARQLKNNVLRNIYNYISDTENYIDVVSGSKKIIIKKENIIDEDIICFKLAVQREITYTAKKAEFTSESMADYPCSLVFLDVVGQTFYVEKNYKIFNKPSEMNKILQAILKTVNANTKEYLDVDFTTNLIVDKSDFMETFKAFDLVSKVSLKLNSPNSFLGNQKADDYLNSLREETNAERMSLEICNDDAGINADGFLEYFDDLFEYAVNGGGEWIIGGKENGRVISKKSTAKGKMLVVDIDFNNIPDNVERIRIAFSKENRYEED